MSFPSASMHIPLSPILLPDHTAGLFSVFNFLCSSSFCFQVSFSTSHQWSHTTLPEPHCIVSLYELLCASKIGTCVPYLENKTTPLESWCLGIDQTNLGRKYTAKTCTLAGSHCGFTGDKGRLQWHRGRSTLERAPNITGKTESQNKLSCKGSTKDH